MASTQSPDHSTRVSGAIVGLLIFLAGVALVGFVFAQAHTLFNAPQPVIPPSAFATPTPAPLPSGAALATVTAAPAAATINPGVIAIGQDLSQFLKQFLLLLLMCIVGSAVASLGINLFFKSIAAPRHAVGANTPNP